MVGCCAYNCSNNSSRLNKLETGEKPSFDKFPQGQSVRNRWIQQLRLENFVLKPHSRLCQAHFTPECYVRNPETLLSLGLEGERLTLKPDAVPTIFNRGSPKGKKQVKGRKQFKSKVSKLQPYSPSKSLFGLVTGKMNSPKKRGAYEKRQRKDVSVFYINLNVDDR